MLVDRTTETITHFIGLFGMTVEQARLREIYEEFAKLRKQQDLDPIEEQSPIIEHHYKLATGSETPLAFHFDAQFPGPQLAAISAPLPQHALTMPAPEGSALPEFDIPAGPWPFPHVTYHHYGPPVVPEPEPPDTPTGPVLRVDPALPFPGSVMNLVDQGLWLSDNDVLGEANFAPRADAGPDMALMAEGLQQLAGSLPEAGVVLRLEAAEAMAEAMLETAEAYFAPELETMTPASHVADPAPQRAGGGHTSDTSEGVRIDWAVFHGEEAAAQIVNGARAEEAPSLKALLPQHHRPEENSEPTDDAIDPRALPEEAGRNPDFEDGHSLVTGGNYAVNETILTTAWVDAPVIVAGGKWIELDQIEQVAAVSDRDSQPPATEAQRSVVTQIAEISETSAPSPRHVQSLEKSSVGPAWVHIDWIDGDLIVSHHIKQLIQLFDNDTFGVSIAAASTAFILGDNTLFNVSEIFALGMHYDQILVGGNLIEINAISQILSLEDNDRISGAPEASKGAPVAPVETETTEPDTQIAEEEEVSDRQIAEVSSGGRDHAVQGTAQAGDDTAGLPEDESAGAPDPALDGSATETEEPLTATPDPAQADAVLATEPETGSGPETEGPESDLAADAPLDEVTDALTAEAEDAPQGNMLLNEARIEKTGVDTAVEATDSLSEIVAGMDDDMEMVREKLLQDQSLAGLEYARVLAIKGDLIQSRIVEQEIRMQDNDDIDLPTELPDGMELVSGQNALANLAKINDAGIDSDIMASKGEYSDLLIHQASLIDDEVSAKGALVSEAVAFLAEEELSADQMMADKMADMGHIQTAAQMDDLSSAMT